MPLQRKSLTNLVIIFLLLSGPSHATYFVDAVWKRDGDVIFHNSTDHDALDEKRDGSNDWEPFRSQMVWDCNTITGWDQSSIGMYTSAEAVRSMDATARGGHAGTADGNPISGGHCTRARRTVTTASGGLYMATYVVRGWTKEQAPPKCNPTVRPIDLGSGANDQTLGGFSVVTVTCNKDTDFTLRIGTDLEAGQVSYAAGGLIQMSFDDGVPTHPYVYRGSAGKQKPVDIVVRATTVPGTAAPGRYVASAILSIDLQ